MADLLGGKSVRNLAGNFFDIIVLTLSVPDSFNKKYLPSRVEKPTRALITGNPSSPVSAWIQLIPRSGYKYCTKVSSSFEIMATCFGFCNGHFLNFLLDFQELPGMCSLDHPSYRNSRHLPM
jgi:hypothetical protein